MKILVVGGTRFFGIPMVQELIENGHEVTIATRGRKPDPFGSQVQRIIMDKTDADSVKNALCGKSFDTVIDKVAYSSNDVRPLLSELDCGRYIQMSSCAVYETAHMGIKENEFDARGFELKWLDRPSDYALGKRLAERAALEYMDESRCVFVRFPVVLGENDYTGRLAFYVQHICQEKPMWIDFPDAKTSYIHERQAGEFIAGLVDKDLCGALNGCADGVISQREIIEYIQDRCGKRAVFSPEGDKAPYDDNACGTSYDCTKAKSFGFEFGEISSWIYDLLDKEIIKQR